MFATFIHSRVQTCPADEYILLLNNFSHLSGIALLACGKLDGHIEGLLYMLGTMYRWSVTDFSSSLWNIPAPVDQVLDDRVVQIYVKIDALCEQEWPPEQQPGKKSGPRCTCYVIKVHWKTSACSRTQIMYASGQATTYTMTPLSMATGIVEESTGEWNFALFSSVFRVGSVCMRVMDLYMNGIDW